MSDKRVRKYLQVGTMECMLLCMGVALLIGIGFFTIGFWRTLLLAVLLVLGMFIGGVTNKREMMADVANKLFPARAQQAARNLQLAEKVRRTVNNEDFEEEPAEEAAAELADQAEETVQEAAEAVQEQAQEAAEAAADLAEEAKETVTEAAESAAYTLESLGDQAQEAAAEVKDAVQDAAEAAGDFAEEKVQEVSEAAQDVADAAEESVKKAAGAVEEAAADLLNKES